MSTSLMHIALLIKTTPEKVHRQAGSLLGSSLHSEMLVGWLCKYIICHLRSQT